MGYYRFRLADMMPNAWFYKLKEMGKTKSHNNIPRDKKQATKPLVADASSATAISQPRKSNQNSHYHHTSHRRHSSYPRKSYYFTRELVSNDKKFHHSPTNSKHSDTHFPDPPRKSSKRRLRKRRGAARYSSDPMLVTSSVSASCSCRATATTTLWTKSSDSPPDYFASSSDESSEFCEADSFPPEFRSDRILTTDSFDNMFVSDGIDDHDIIIDMDKKFLGARFDKLDIPDLDLPPIITKPNKFDEDNNNLDKDTRKEITKETAKYRNSTTPSKLQEKNSRASILSVKEMKEDKTLKYRNSTTPSKFQEKNSRASILSFKEMKENKTLGSFKKRHSLNSPGLKLRVNSPRITASRKFQGGRKSLSSNSSSSSRRSLSDSLAIVKSSFDPQKDFKESMVEMITENNIRESKDLENLLACYLFLNSDEYHGLIIKVFKQIWIDLTKTPSK